MRPACIGFVFRSRVYGFAFDKGKFRGLTFDEKIAAIERKIKHGR